MPKPDPAVSSPDLLAADLLTADEVARWLGITKRTLKRLCDAGTFPRPIKWSSKLMRFLTLAIEAWLESLPAEGQAVTKGA